MKPYLLLIGAILLAGCSAQKGAETFKDPWSGNCSSGEYAVFSANGSVCEPPRACLSDLDCKYLEVDKLPPRVGSCSGGRCTAFCGSGMIRECLN
ncbi:MAG: hypothetical protein U0R44_05210 [Candidatus Micrarchaeia archaeon]